jgi:hypothetical protein
VSPRGWCGCRVRPSRSLPTPTLHSERRSTRLPTPSAETSPHHGAITPPRDPNRRATTSGLMPRILGARHRRFPSSSAPNHGPDPAALARDEKSCYFRVSNEESTYCGRNSVGQGRRMPFEFKGCGTQYIGERDLRPDGSFVTTEWITLLHLPLVPLRSARVVRDRSEDVNVVIVSHKGYLEIERLSIRWDQIGGTYLFLFLSGLWAFTSGWFFFGHLDIFEHPHGMYLAPLWVIIAGLPFFWLWWSRREKYKARYGMKAAQPGAHINPDDAQRIREDH